MEPKVTGKQIVGAVVVALGLTVFSVFLIFAMSFGCGMGTDKATVYTCNFVIYGGRVPLWFNIIGTIVIAMCGGAESKRFNKILSTYVGISIVLICILLFVPMMMMLFL